MSEPALPRGEVWVAHLDRVRPLAVLTRDPMGSLLNAVIGAPVTSTVRGVSTDLGVGPEDGVRLDSVATLDNMQLVPRGRLIPRVGRVTPVTMSAICSALAIAVGCE